MAFPLLNAQKHCTFIRSSQHSSIYCLQLEMLVINISLLSSCLTFFLFVHMFPNSYSFDIFHEPKVDEWSAFEGNSFKRVDQIDWWTLEEHWYPHRIKRAICRCMISCILSSYAFYFDFLYSQKQYFMDFLLVFFGSFAGSWSGK